MKKINEMALEMLKEKGVEYHSEHDTELKMDVITISHGDAEVVVYVGADTLVKWGLGLDSDIECMYLGDNDSAQGIRTEDGKYYLAYDDRAADCGLSGAIETDIEYMLNVVCSFHKDAEIFTKIIK